MDKRMQQLLDEYEELMATIAVEDLCEAEGDRLLEELASLPDIEPSKDELRRIENTIDQALAARNDTAKARHVKKRWPVVRIAVCVALVSLFAANSLSGGAIQNAFKKMFLIDNGIYTSVTWSSDKLSDLTSPDLPIIFKDSDIPSNYTLSKNEPLTTTHVIEYKDTQGHILSFIWRNESNNANIDSETIEGETIYIRGNPGVYTLVGDYQNIIWIEQGYAMAVCTNDPTIDLISIMTNQ